MPDMPNTIASPANLGLGLIVHLLTGTIAGVANDIFGLGPAGGHPPLAVAGLAGAVLGGGDGGLSLSITLRAGPLFIHVASPLRRDR